MSKPGIIAVLHSDSAPGMRSASDDLDPEVCLLDLARLKDGDLDSGIGAVLYPITEATDSLHREVERFKDAVGAVPVISYSDGPVDDEVRDRSRRLGCVTHVEAPLSPTGLKETVQRERRLGDALEALRRTREEARREHEKITSLVEIIKTANSVLEPARVMDVVMEKAQSSLRSEMWCLFLVDERDEFVTFERAGGINPRRPENYRVPLGQGIEGWVMKNRRPLILNEVKADGRYDSDFDNLTGIDSRSVLATPLVSRGRVIGVVKLVNRIQGDCFSPDDQSLVTLLMEPAAIALENAILFKRMEELSVTDDLTRLYNVRYLNGFLFREMKRCQRYQFPVSLIFLDMDGFKTVNDRYGHLAGSQTLTEVGQLLRQTVRDIDVVARYGGDEFVVVLPQTDTVGAVVIAERLRRRIEKATYLRGMGLSVHLTASLGVAGFPEQGKTRDELIHKADAAMYRVKESGKNGVLLA